MSDPDELRRDIAKLLVEWATLRERWHREKDLPKAMGISAQQMRVEQALERLAKQYAVYAMIDR